MFHTKSRIGVTGGKVLSHVEPRRGRAELASFGSGGGGGMSMSAAGSGNGKQLDLLLTGLLPTDNEAQLRKLYMDMYTYDSVCGSACDLMSVMPFSDFTLTGQDDKVIEVYETSMERLSLRNMLPEISLDYLVNGLYCSTLIFDNQLKAFLDSVPFQPGQVEVVGTPLYSRDPLIKIKPDAEMKKFFASSDPYLQRLKEQLPPKLVEAFRSAVFSPDPLTTIYMPRRTFTHQVHGVSFLKRALPIYLLEKHLFRGTLIEASRRMRSIFHVQAGDDNWEPTPDEMATLTALFQQAELDPLGAIVTTRNAVQTTEARQGGDFWKYTDVLGDTTPIKLRALGISEGFLGSEQSYACVVGDTLIPTEFGLIPIAELVYPENGDLQNLGLKVGSRYAPETAAKWLYSGYHPTIKVKTDIGNSVQGTPVHKMLVLQQDYTTDWVELQHLHRGDLLCVSLNSACRTTPLALNLTHVEPNSGRSGVLKAVDVPSHMTPDLAFAIGCLISDGHVAKQKTAMVFYSTSERLADKYMNSMRTVFGQGLHFTEAVRESVAGEVMHVRKNGAVIGTGVTTGTSCTTYRLTSKAVHSLLGQLGLTHTSYKYGKSPSHYKTIPWSILEADAESQYAFLAAYLECDGHIAPKTNEVSYTSYSTKLVQQLLIMLQTLGHRARISSNGTTVVLTGTDGVSLYEHLRPYMVNKTVSDIPSKGRGRLAYGLPIDSLRNFVNSRVVSTTPTGSMRYGNKGTQYLTDSGAIIVSDKALRKLVNRASRLTYDGYDQGNYAVALATLAAISPSLHRNVTELLELKYDFSAVTSVCKGKDCHVYDLSMKRGVEPAYVVNGLVGHNTSEVALSTFLESIKAYRSMVTQKLFYNKMFPVIAVGNDLYKDGASRADGKRFADMGFAANDSGLLKIPDVKWHKSLQATNDRDTFEMLQALTEHGVPVPLRMWVAAGGVEFESLLRDMQQDKTDRDRLTKLAADQGHTTDGGADDAFASFHRRPMSILSRDFGGAGELDRTSRTGVRHHEFNQAGANARINSNIAKAVANLSDPHRYSQVARKVKSRLGYGSTA